MHSCAPVKADHPRLQVLQQVHLVCENDGMTGFCVSLGGWPMHCLCYFICLHGQTGVPNNSTASTSWTDQLKLAKFRLRSGHCQLLFHHFTLKISPSGESPCSTSPHPLPQPHPTVLPHLRSSETPDIAQSGGSQRKLWGPVKTLRQSVNFA